MARQLLRLPDPIHRLTTAATLASFLILSSPAQAQIFDDDYKDRSAGVDLSAQLGLKSDRIFRGQNLYNGVSIQPQIQAQFKLGEGNLHGKLFSHIGAEGSDPRDSDGAPFNAVDDEGNSTRVAQTQPGFNELDNEVGYAIGLDQVRLDFGHRFYFYDETSPRLQDTREIYATATLDTPLYPYAEVAYDYDDFEGFFYALGARYPFPLGLSDERSILVPFVELGFSSALDDGNKAIYNDGGLEYVDIGTRSQLYLNPTTSIEPEVWYNYGVDDATSSELTFGVNIVSELK